MVVHLAYGLYLDAYQDLGIVIGDQVRPVVALLNALGDNRHEQSLLEIRRDNLVCHLGNVWGRAHPGVVKPKVSLLRLFGKPVQELLSARSTSLLSSMSRKAAGSDLIIQMPLTDSAPA